MSIDKQPDLFETQPTETVTEAPAHTPEPVAEAKPQKMSVREAIDDAVRQERARDESGRFAREQDKPAPRPAKTDAPAPSAPEQTSSDAPKAEAPRGAPQSWAKEAKAQWDSLPPSIQAEVHRREADTAKGVQQLKSRYEAIDRVVAPYQGLLQQRGVEPAQAIQALAQMYMSFANPNKDQAKAAFHQIARSLNVDLSNPGSASSAAPGAVPNVSIPPEYSNRINYLTNRVQQMDNAALESRINDLKKGKPHFDSVKTIMGNLVMSDLNSIQMGGQGRYVRNGDVDWDSVYNDAVYATPETRAQVLADEQAKKAAAQKAANDKARAAGVSVRGGTPAAPAANGQAPQKYGSVRDAIRAAVGEVRSR